MLGMNRFWQCPKKQTTGWMVFLGCSLIPCRSLNQQDLGAVNSYRYPPIMEADARRGSEDYFLLGNLLIALILLIILTKHIVDMNYLILNVRIWKKNK